MSKIVDDIKDSMNKMPSSRHKSSIIIKSVVLVVIFIILVPMAIAVFYHPLWYLGFLFLIPLVIVYPICGVALAYDIKLYKQSLKREEEEKSSNE